MNKGQTARHATIAHRRKLVMAMRLRGMTQRAIVDELQKQDCVRRMPDGSVKPWSLAIINADISLIMREWRTEAERAAEDLRAQAYHRLEAVIGRAFGGKDWSAVLAAIKQQRELMALDMPKPILLGGALNADPIPVQATATVGIFDGIDLSKLSIDTLEKLESAAAVFASLADSVRPDPD